MMIINARLLNKINQLTGYRFEKLFGFCCQKEKFYRLNGYPLDLRCPRSFCEKVVWKKIHDRNPLLTLTADKYLVRKYVECVLGKENAAEVLIPLLYVTDAPKTIPFTKLPDRYVVKPNHASGKVIIVKEGNPAPGEIVNTCMKWLARPYGRDKHEWAYHNIQRKIIVEKMLLDEKGQIPREYKLFMFHGKCCMIRISSNRFGEGGLRRSAFTPQWEFIDVSFGRKQSQLEDKPSNLRYLINIAEKLSIYFDFVRVDLYSVAGNIYFSELTHYPTSGMVAIEPVEFDFQLGNLWELKPNYWKQSEREILELVRAINPEECRTGG